MIIYFLGSDNSTTCQCSADSRCLAFRKGYEILYPFNMEFCVLAGCMLFVMWKNVGRHVTTKHTSHAKTSLFSLVSIVRVVFGFLLGVLVLLIGIVMFVLYQLWQDQEATHLTAFLLFYGFHLSLFPVMSLCTLAATLLQSHLVRQKETRTQIIGQEGPKNPTQRLDVALLLVTAVGQLYLSYLSFVAALALGSNGVIGNLDLSYSLLSLVELVLQNIFIIRGLHLPYSKVSSALQKDSDCRIDSKEDEEKKNCFPKVSFIM